MVRLEHKIKLYISMKNMLCDITVQQYSKGEIFAGTGRGKHPGSQEKGRMEESSSLAERTENKNAAMTHKAYIILT